MANEAFLPEIKEFRYVLCPRIMEQIAVELQSNKYRDRENRTFLTDYFRDLIKDSGRTGEALIDISQCHAQCGVQGLDHGYLSCPYRSQRAAVNHRIYQRIKLRNSNGWMQGETVEDTFKRWIIMPPSEETKEAYKEQKKKDQVIKERLAEENTIMLDDGEGLKEIEEIRRRHPDLFPDEEAQ